MTEAMRVVNAMFFVSLFACAHAGFRGGPERCLGGDRAPTGPHPGISQAYGAFWREHARAAAVTSPLVAGRILEDLPALILDGSDVSPEARRAGPDLAAEIAEVLDHKPIAVLAPARRPGARGQGVCPMSST